LLQTVLARLMKMLTRQGVMVEDMGQTCLAEPDAEGDEARTLRPLQAAAVSYRIAFDPRAGQKVLTPRGAMPRDATTRQPLCADIDGLSLHAAVRIEGHDRKRLEQLCRHITRPALSDGRVQLDAARQVELRLKTPCRDGTTHLVMSPLEFMQRLAALVPRPPLLLTRFHGVLAPKATLRPLVVPRGPPRRHRRPPRPQPKPSAKSSPAKRDRVARAGPGCSSGSSTSTCSTARTETPGNRRSSRPSWSGR
jgi:Putative transposase